MNVQRIKRAEDSTKLARLICQRFPNIQPMNEVKDELEHAKELIEEEIESIENFQEDN